MRKSVELEGEGRNLLILVAPQVILKAICIKRLDISMFKKFVFHVLNFEMLSARAVAKY